MFCYVPEDASKGDILGWNPSREGLSEYHYLLILMKIWRGYWKNQLENTDIKVDEEDGKFVGMVNGRASTFLWFPCNEFWENVGCLVSYPTFVLGGTSLW